MTMVTSHVRPLSRALVVSLLLVSLSSAAMTSLLLTGSIDASGSSILTIDSEFTGSEGKTVFLNLSGPVSEVTVKDRSGLVLDSTVREAGNYTLIYADVPVDFLEFRIVSSSFTAKAGPEWDFDLSLGSSENISDFNASISLPKGAVLKSTNGAVTGGESLLIGWKAGSIDTSHKAHLRAGYELSALPPIDPFYIAGIAVIGIVLAYALARFSRKKPAAGRPAEAPVPDSLESNSVFKTLDETDREIVREISRSGGKTTQSRLYLQTHVPKATLSRRMASLENRGLIRRSRKGNRNLVTLTDILGK